MTIAISDPQLWFGIGFLTCLGLVIALAWLWGRKDTDEDEDAPES